MLYNYAQQVAHYNEHTKPIKCYKISTTLFDKFMEYKSAWFQQVNHEEYHYLLHGLADKRAMYYLHDTGKENGEYKIVCNAGNSFYYIKGLLLESHAPKALIDEMDKLIISCNSKSYDFIIEYCTDDVINNKPRKPTTVLAKEFLTKGIQASFTKESFEQFIVQHGDLSRVEPMRVRTEYSTSVEKWNNCVYADIHKAHASELLKMFAGTPMAAAVDKKLKLYKFYKQQGNAEKCQEIKDILNYAVGFFHKTKKDKNGIKIKGVADTFLFDDVDTFPLYNRIVNNIYAKGTDMMDKLCGSDLSKCVYAQTDGLIVHNPICEIADNPEVGEFGVEFRGTVYTYHCEGIPGYNTGYTIYQYTDEQGRHVKGDLPNVLKKEIDLEKGRVVIYKKNYDEYEYIHSNVLEIKEVQLHENK